VPIVHPLDIFNLLPRLLNELMATVSLDTIFEAVAGDPEQIRPAMKGPNGFLRLVRLKNGRFAEVLSREEQGVLQNERQRQGPMGYEWSSEVKRMSRAYLRSPAE
jgi:hypothetical protein